MQGERDEGSGGNHSISDPIPENNLRTRRVKLGLSRVALGRILDVDPATVFRHEQGPLMPLWDYALRGVEAEAASKSSKMIVQSYRSRLADQTFIPEQLAARGFSFTAEKMNEARLQRPRKKSRKLPRSVETTLVKRGPRALTQSEIAAAVKRAEERSKRGR
jgi:DNA-binding XRE family transcriptional regulator